jgi:dihydrofolate synthase/folylpolyglutamate synthase
MRYSEAFAYINSFTNYEVTPGMQRDPGLEGLKRVRNLMGLLGNPQDGFKSVVVAGTKGKGSVVAMLESVLREAGYKTGMYTSPHLHTFRERIRINGEMIPPQDMARIVEQQIKPVAERLRAAGDRSMVPTTYDLATAIAFLYFREMAVDIAVLEVGLGGRLDAVNIAQPLVSVLTSISMDHMEVLGDTLEKIAFEKAGIIKPGGQVVSAPQHPSAMAVINRVAAERGAQLTVVGNEVYVSTAHLPEVVYDDEGIPVYQAFSLAVRLLEDRPEVKLRVKLPLLGSHQEINAAVAVAALGRLVDKGFIVSKEELLGGLAKVHWPGRMEIVHRKPVVVVDGAHNVESISKLSQAITDLFYKRQVILVLGVSRDKDIPGIAAEIRAWSQSVLGQLVERVLVTRSRHPRAGDPAVVALQLLNQGLTVEVCRDVGEALDHATALAGSLQKANPSAPGPVVVVTGSLFVVAEAREHYGLAPDLSDEHA